MRGLQQLTTMQALGMHRTTPGLTSSSRCSPPACPARLSAHAARQGKPAALPCSASAPPSVMQRTEVMAGHGTTTIEKPRPAEAASATHPTSTSTSTSLQHRLAPASAPSVRELSPANFDQAVSSEGLVLVDFYTVGVAVEWLCLKSQGIHLRELTMLGLLPLLLSVSVQDYCGPCKLMHAQLDKLQTAFKKIKFMKYVLGAHSKGATGD